jgi:hypothetical protein
MATMTDRFEMSFNGFNRVLFGILGIGPKRTRIELDDESLLVRLSYGFSARVPRSAITGTERYTGRVGGWGAHGWRGVWLVNGSSKGIVRVSIDPVQRAAVIGFPVKLRELLVSVTEPDAFMAALGVGTPPGPLTPRRGVARQ